ncbi:MAG: YebC/PmpR family DNA-binding transcriptional regulator [bacterium]
MNESLGLQLSLMGRFFMAGHNKWSQIKHKKAKTDAQRGKAFTKVIKEISVAVKLGGEDIATNASLRLAIQKAKSVNMPQTNITRAIAKASGSDSMALLHEWFFEAYGPGGVAILIKVLTDNKNRTVPNLKVILSKNGGRLVEKGSVSYLFAKKGLFVFEPGVVEEDVINIAIEAGAEDVLAREDGSVEVVTEVSFFDLVKKAFDAADMAYIFATLTMLPQKSFAISEDDQAKVLKLLDCLDDDDDVQDIYCNMA